MDALKREADAYAALSELMVDADRCATKFERAGLPLPARLARFLERASQEGGADEQLVLPSSNSSPPNPRPKRPRALDTHEMAGSSAEAGFIQVPWEDLSTTTAVLALLREAGTASMDDLIAAASLRGRDVSRGTLFNIGARLEKEGVLSRESTSWTLVAGAQVASLSKDGTVASGPPDAFTPQETAVFRRERVLAFFGSRGASGARRSEVLDALRSDHVAFADVSTHVVQADLRELASRGRIVCDRATKMWRLDGEGN